MFKKGNYQRRTFTIINRKTAELFIILHLKTIEMQFNLEIKTNDAKITTTNKKMMRIN